MATRTETLQGRLTLQDAEWQAGLARAASQFKGFSGNVGRMLSQAASSGINAFKGIGSVLGGIVGQATQLLSILGGVGGVLSVAGITMGIKQTTDLGGKLSDVSAKTGIAVKDLVVLQEQFRQGGMGDDIEVATGYMRRMGDALRDAKKGDVFQALGLDQAKLKAGGTLEAFDKILQAVSKLGDLNAQQGALGSLFGGRQGIQLMTLVKDGDSRKNAERMVGEMKDAFGRSAVDMDFVSDNLFGGIPIKMRQLFAGFTGNLLPALKKAADWVMDLDLTAIGGRLSEQLVWAWKVFEQIIRQGEVLNFLWSSLKNIFMAGAAYFTGIMGAAWNAIFSKENMMVAKGMFDALTMHLGAGIEDALHGILPSWMLGKNQSAGKREAAGMILENTMGLAGDMVPETGRRFMAAAGAIDPADLFGAAFSQNQGDLKTSIMWAGMQSGAGARSPMERAGGWIPGLTPSMGKASTDDKFITSLFDHYKKVEEQNQQANAYLAGLAHGLPTD